MSPEQNLDPAEAVGPDEQADALDPMVGAGTPETAPYEEPVVSWFSREPIVAALVVANAPLLAGAVTSLAEGAPWYVSTLVVAATGLLNLVGGLARRAVTPTARPRTDDGTALTP